MGGEKEKERYFALTIYPQRGGEEHFSLTISQENYSETLAVCPRI